MRQRDIRDTPLFRQAEDLYRQLRQPGAGLIFDGSDISAHADRVVFSATIVESLAGSPPTRICITDLDTGASRILTSGPGVDRFPRFSPDGSKLAFLSDRRRAGEFQLFLLNLQTGEVANTPPVAGWVEYLQWSPAGTQILLAAAENGADVAGVQGAALASGESVSLPAWMPTVAGADDSSGWRRLWLYQVESNNVQPVNARGCNVWEASWCGEDRIVAIVSPGPSEGLWYSARLHVIEVTGGNAHQIYAPTYQLGCLCASPGGEIAAVVEALCSDRCLVAGEVTLVETNSGKARVIATGGMDVTFMEWRSDRSLLLAGHRRFEACVGIYNTDTDRFTETWSSRDITSGIRYISVSGLDQSADCVLIGEGFTRAPEIAVIRSGRYRTVKSLAAGAPAVFDALGAIEPISWFAMDGLQIDGWLLRPKGPAPHPVVMYIHGGPVWQWRPVWLGRAGIAPLMLLRRGYAIFYPNPRGSSGRGQEFARRVLGDIGGADTRDCLSGLDYLVQNGIAEPEGLGVTGLSYGGFMTSWLITQDTRFAAAVAVGPHTNQVTEYLLSNIPQFMTLFLGDSYRNVAGKFFHRSPIMHAHKVRTPTLNICGALDRCTPPEEALQFHNALLQNGAPSTLITYPEEGHGIRGFPAVIDFTARVVGWFQEHMSPQR